MNAMSTRPVVVGLDRSDQGRAAVEYAAELASRRQLPLRLVHVFEPIRFGARPTAASTPDIERVVQNSAQRLVDETVEVLAAVYPAVVVTSALEVGSPSERLIEESENAHTLVLGSRGTGGFADLVVGSTTMHVTAHAWCPVIAVPSPPDTDVVRHGVIVGVDGSDAAEAALGYAFEVASDVGETLTAIHAWHDPVRTGVGTITLITYDPEEDAKAERLALAETLSGWQAKFPDVVVEANVVLGHPVPTLVSRARHARLLVVGSRGRGALSSLILGSVSHGVLHHATGPVAVVHRSV